MKKATKKTQGSAARPAFAARPAAVAPPQVVTLDGRMDQAERLAEGLEDRSKALLTFCCDEVLEAGEPVVPEVWTLATRFDAHQQMLERVAKRLERAAAFLGM